MKPCLLARMVNQVGSPAIFDGNIFFPDTGIPIWKMDRISTMLAVWLPDPFTVAIWMLKSFVICRSGSPERVSTGATWRVDIYLSGPYEGDFHCWKFQVQLYKNTALRA